MQVQTTILQDRLLTLQEAASYMRCSTVFIWKIRKDGKLHALKAGKKVLFQKSAIDLYLGVTTEGGAHA